MVSLFKIIFLLGTGFFLSCLTVWLVRFYARRFEWMDSTKANRWHRYPRALHGGVGMMAAWLPLSLFLIAREGGLTPLLGGFLIGAFLIFSVGLLDDFFHFQPATKLVWQIIAASFLVGQGILIQASSSYDLNVLITFIWFIGIINAVNMLDNMDGLASGVVALSSLVLLVLFAAGGGMLAFPVKWLAVFIGILLGFLVYNFNPASIFMGDSGSLFIGYFLAAMSIPSRMNQHWFSASSNGITPFGLTALLAPAMILIVPIFDTSLVTISRILHGRPASEGGKDHSSHRLVGLGLSERQAVLVLYCIAALGGAISVLSYFFRGYAWSLFFTFLALLAIFGYFLNRYKVYDKEPPKEWTPLVTHWMHKRRFSEAMTDFIFIILAYHLAFRFLFGGLPPEMDNFYQQTLPWVVVVMFFSFWVCGYYRGLWRIIHWFDFGRYLEGCMLASAILAGLYAMHSPVGTFHFWSVLSLFVALLLGLILIFRLILRGLGHFLHRGSAPQENPLPYVNR